MEDLENKIILESENNIKDEKIETLTDIIVNMQKTLNFIDGRRRANNVIVTGISEYDINVKDDDGNEILLANDVSKVKSM